MEVEKNKVMVAIDESECSYYALQWAIDSLGLENSHVILFTVQPYANLGYVYATTAGAAPMDLVRTLQENQKKAALALLKKAKDICAEHGIDAEVMTEVGDPKEVICDAAEKHNIHLLVVGSHNKGALERTFLGSVSNYSVHHAKCPVLVVKKKNNK